VGLGWSRFATVIFDSRARAPLARGATGTFAALMSLAASLGSFTGVVHRFCATDQVYLNHPWEGNLF
jgi:hypothetical protein